MKRTLGRKLVLLFLGFCAAPLLGLSVVSDANSIRAVRRMLLQQTSRDAGRLGAGLVEAIETLERDTANIAALGFMREHQSLRILLERRRPLEAPADISEPMRIKSRVSQLVLVDSAGTPLFKLYGPAPSAGTLLSMTRQQTEDFTALDTVGVALAGGNRAGEVEFLRLGPPDGVPRLRGVVPVFLPGQDRSAAFLLADIELSRLADQVVAEKLPAPVGDAGARFAAFAVDLETGAFVHHRDPARVQQVVSLAAPALWADMTVGEHGLDRLIEAAETGGLRRKPVQLAGLRHDLAAAAIAGSYRDGDEREDLVYSGLVLRDLGLVLGVTAVRSPFVEPFRRAAGITLAAMVLVLGACAVLLALFSRSFRQAIRALTRGSEAIARGDFGHRVRVSSGDEMEELAGAFNRMGDELERLTREREETARFESLNRFVSVVLHDLKGLVTNLSLLAENLTRRGEDARFRADAVATLNSLADRMKVLVARLPTLGERAMEPPPRTPVDLGALVHDVVQEIGFASQEEFHVSCVLPDAPVELPLDVEGMRRAIRNLVTNAVEAMPGGGQLDIRLELAAGDASGTGSAPGAPPVAELRIADSGPGISPALARRLFRPFQTTKAQGLGLGLYSAREVVQAHGGEIRVESEAGRGTVFTVVLPLIDPARGSDVGAKGVLR